MPQRGDVVEALGDPLTTPRPVPWGGAVARLRASEALRRFVPAPLAMAALDLGHRLAARRDPQRLAQARATMEAVVGGTHRERDLDRLAVRHLSAWARGWELMWRPWLLASMPVEGAKALRDLEPGRGVIFSVPHFGPLVGVAALPRVVGPVHAAVGEHMVAAEAPAGYHGYQNEQVRKVLRDFGFRMVRAMGSARTFTEVLEGGGRVLINLDVPGKAPVRFLGKPVELMNGTARLAIGTDSVIVPAVPLPRGRKWYVHLGAPLDPREHDSWEDLLQATVTAVEDLVLRAPEYFENPLRESGWAVADRTGWRRSA
jgi:lauroyl/myristoyl acyltransferase